MKKRLIAASVLLAFGFGATHAAPTVLTYDLAPYNGDGTLEKTFSAPGFSSSSMSIVGLPNGTFSNHFYTSGWSAGVDLGKYFTVTLSATAPFTLDKMLFSVESTSSASATVAVRSNLNGFATDIDSFTWASASTDVTNGDFDLASLGLLSAPLELRFYFQGVGPALGFANHETGGTGGGLPDTGRDISFTANTVPEPGSIALISAALLGVAASGRRSKKS